MSLNDAIAKTTLPVEDLARARAFYAEKLGLRPTREFASALITKMAWFVKDIVVSVAKLKSRGVQFEEYDVPGLKTNQGIADLGYEKAAWFRDSEGNLLALGELA